VCHTSAGAAVTNQAEHLSRIRRSRVTDQVVPLCQASPGARHSDVGRVKVRLIVSFLAPPDRLRVAHRPGSCGRVLSSVVPRS
jgi:hypothetical protein